MPITITKQPIQDSLNVAYRPIVFKIEANVTNSSSLDYIPPVVYCDVYMNDIYYKSFSKTQFKSINSLFAIYEFDIQDAIQESMSYNLPTLDGSQVLQFNNSIIKVSVKFRNAKLDSDGFIISEQLAPIQKTDFNDSVSGDGEISNYFYVINSTIQHIENQNVEQFLENYKTGVWKNDAFPLTKRPKKIFIGKNDSSYFPIIGNEEIKCLEISYRNKGEDNFNNDSYCFGAPLPKNLVITNTVYSDNPLGGKDVTIDFTFDFIISNLVIQVSTDNINWTNAPNISLGTTSPIISGNVSINNAFIRLTDSGVVSNSIHWFQITPNVDIVWEDTQDAIDRIGSNSTIIIEPINLSIPFNCVLKAQKLYNGNFITISIPTNNYPKYMAFLNAAGVNPIDEFRYAIFDSNNLIIFTSNTVKYTQSASLPPIVISSNISCQGNNNVNPAPTCGANGTITINSGTYVVKAKASIFTGSNCGITINAVVNGITLTATNFSGQGQDHYSVNSITLSPGTYNYSFTNSFSGTNGSAEGSIDIQ
jgi:hypothetical protein